MALTWGSELGRALMQVYRAQNRDRPVHVYVLMYDQSIDEQRYVMSVARERNAFERLIKERAVRCQHREGCTLPPLPLPPPP